MSKSTIYILFGVVIVLLLGNIALYFYPKKSDKKEIVKVEQLEDTNPIYNEDNNGMFFKKKTKIQFEEDLYNLDTLKEGTVVRRDMYFTNTGDNPFFITNLKASCGCTVPTYESKPIEPGERSKITIEFNSEGKVGFQMNKVTIYGNLPKDETSVFFKAFVK